MNSLYKPTHFLVLVLCLPYKSAKTSGVDGLGGGGRAVRMPLAEKSVGRKKNTLKGFFFYFLHSTDFKLLREIKVNSLNN
jgi:hypothetical protein